MALIAILADERETELSGSTQLRRRGAPSHKFPAWMLSMALHVSLVLAWGFSMPMRRSPEAERARPAGIALVHRYQSREIYISPSNSASAAASQQPAATGGLPSFAEVPIEPAYRLPKAAEIYSAVAAADRDLPSSQGLMLDKQPSRQLPAGGTTTRVFGAEGYGSKFVYVFDRSASMQGFQGKPLLAAKAELMSSLRDLASVHQFQIVFYNELVSVFRPLANQPPRMLFGSDENKRLAEQYVRTMIAVGATRHRQALELALNLQPDVIFLLTDAAEPALTRNELAQIQRRNRGVTAIHAIELGAGPNPGGDNFLVQLARQNGGQHVYVDVSRLP